MAQAAFQPQKPTLIDIPASNNGGRVRTKHLHRIAALHLCEFTRQYDTGVFYETRTFCEDLDSNRQ